MGWGVITQPHTGVIGGHDHSGVIPQRPAGGPIVPIKKILDGDADSQRFRRTTHFLHLTDKDLLRLPPKPRDQIHPYPQGSEMPLIGLDLSRDVLALHQHRNPGVG